MQLYWASIKITFWNLHERLYVQRKKYRLIGAYGTLSTSHHGREKNILTIYFAMKSSDGLSNVIFSELFNFRRLSMPCATTDLTEYEIILSFFDLRWLCHFLGHEIPAIKK